MRGERLPVLNPPIKVDCKGDRPRLSWGMISGSFCFGGAKALSVDNTAKGGTRAVREN